jgi:hypothetical protein
MERHNCGGSGFFYFLSICGLIDGCPYYGIKSGAN